MTDSSVWMEEDGVIVYFHAPAFFRGFFFIIINKQQKFK